MKKLLKKYFHVPREEKIPDRVMTAWGLLTLLLILIYLAAMALAAYAFYTYDGIVGNNAAQTAAQIAGLIL